ncbi:MAG: chloramphenicol acetyltransferase [Bacteroidales bacterium]|nr:chloramphenicol acetyltransferase [Bacteroidales bacterium]
MYQLLTPAETPRATAYKYWHDAPMPMITFIKTLDVSRLYRISRRRGIGFNKLMCYCIGRAAQSMPEMLLLLWDDSFRRYDSLSVNVIVRTQQGGIAFCDVPYTSDFAQFSADYDRFTRQVSITGEMYDLTDSRMSIGTSALVHHNIDAIVNGRSGHWNTPFIAWSRYRRGFFHVTLPLTFQFHHAQMDGEPAATFLDRLQEAVSSFRAR